MDQFIDQIVPITLFVMIVAVVIGPIWINAYFKARERQQMHETLRVAYEKGQPPPPELIEKLTAGMSTTAGNTPQSAPDNDLRRAVVLIAVGIGLAFLGLGMGWGIGMASGVGGSIVGGIIAGSGAIPGFIGLAYLMLWLMGRGHRPTV